LVFRLPAVGEVNAEILFSLRVLNSVWIFVQAVETKGPLCCNGRVESKNKEIRAQKRVSYAKRAFERNGLCIIGLRVLSVSTLGKYVIQTLRSRDWRSCFVFASQFDSRSGGQIL
jgi:hypothetical protein